jgi:hypothetical protein
MLDTAKVRVCSVVNTDVAGSCRSTALPLRLAPEEKRFGCKHSSLFERPSSEF